MVEVCERLQLAAILMLQPKFIDFRVKYGATEQERARYEKYCEWCKKVIQVEPAAEDIWLREDRSYSFKKFAS
jgi:hypothetical protein